MKLVLSSTGGLDQVYNNFKNGLNQYRQATVHSKSVCEQTAFLFDQIAKIITESETAFAAHEFSKGAELSMKALDIATGLCSILMPDNDSEEARMNASGQSWQVYFMDLIQTISRISNTHNKVLLEKTLLSLSEMASLWRFQAKQMSNTTASEMHQNGGAPLMSGLNLDA